MLCSLELPDTFELAEARPRVNLRQIDSPERFPGCLNRDNARGDLVAGPLVHSGNKAIENDACQSRCLVGFEQFIQVRSAIW